MRGSTAPVEQQDIEKTNNLLELILKELKIMNNLLKLKCIT